MTLETRVDPERDGEDGLRTGIYIRARFPDGRYDNADLAQLDHLSVLRWLRSRGGKNRWAENTVLLLLGHEQMTDEEDSQIDGEDS